MEGMLQFAHTASPLAADVLVGSIWQGVLLIATIVIGLRFAGEVSPAVRSWIWTAVLLLVVCLPVLALVLPRREGAGGGMLHAESGWGFGLLCVWVAASACQGLRLAANGWRLRGLIRRSVPVAVEASIGKLLEAPRRAVLCVSEEVNRPSVAGFVRPRILLPPDLLERLSAAELEQVVLHEMEHLRRYDDWLNLLQQISLVLLPLNPALLWLDRRLCQERELACDDGVLRATRARKAYAACLVKLAEESLLRRGVLLALSALGSRARESELVSRVRRILAGPEPGQIDRRMRFAAGSLLSAAMVFAAMLARSPQLVSFDEASPVVAEAAPAALAPVPVPALRTGAAAGTSGRPMLVNAVMHTSKPVVQRVVVRVKVRRRAAPQSEVRFRSAGRITTAPWLATPGTQPGRVVMTEIEFSQPVYAAVPWRDGWLIVQL